MYSKIKPWVIGLTMVASFSGAAHCQADEPPHIELQRRKCRGHIVRRHGGAGTGGDDPVDSDESELIGDEIVPAGDLSPAMA